MRPILALIPAYNEAAHIAQTVEQAAKHLSVVVVDDGSRDATVQLAESAGAVVLRQVPNQGKGAALRAGFHYALAENYSAIVTLDGDGQHDPHEIPLFIESFKTTGADLIIGARRFEHMPVTRRLANTSGRLLFSWAVGRPIPDNQSGYRLISRRLLEPLLDSTEQGFEFEVEMITTCLKRDYRLDWVPIRTIYGGRASHIQPWKHTVNFFRVVLAARRQMSAPIP